MSSALPHHPIPVTDAAWKAIENATIFRYMSPPDVVPRRIDDLDLAKEFADPKVKGFVLNLTTFHV